MRAGWIIGGGMFIVLGLFFYLMMTLRVPTQLAWTYFFIIIGLVISFRPISRKKKTSTLQETQPVKEIVKEKEIIREVVKIPCSHCGTLIPQESIFWSKLRCSIETLASYR